MKANALAGTGMDRRDLLVYGLALVLTALLALPWGIGKWSEQHALALLSDSTTVFDAPLLPQLGPLVPRTNDAALSQALLLSQRALRWYPYLRTAQEVQAEALLLVGAGPEAQVVLRALSQYPAYGQVQQAERMMLYASYALLEADPAGQGLALGHAGVRGWDLVLASDTYLSAEASSKAELLLRLALLVAPDSGDVWTAWGRFNLKRGNIQLSVEALQHALKLEGFDHVGSSTPGFLLGRLYHEENRPQEALPLLEVAVELDDFSSNRDRGAAYRHLGLLYREQGNEARAQELFQIAAKYTGVPELE